MPVQPVLEIPLPPIQPTAVPLQGESYWDLVFRQFRRNRLAVLCFCFVLALFLVAIGAPFLANNRPIILRGAFRTLYGDRFQEWKLGGHPELVDLLQNSQAPLSPEAASHLQARLGTVEHQLRYLATQLPGDQAPLLLAYLQDYQEAVRSAVAGDDTQLSARLQTLQKNSHEISRKFDPGTVSLEPKFYWPVFAALGPLGFFFLTLTMLLLLLPLIRRVLPPAWKASWKAQALLVLLPAVFLAVLRTGQPTVFETLDYKEQILQGGIESSLALFPPIPYGINEDHLEDKYQPPGLRYWIGTDGNGRDLLTRMIWGSRISLSVGFVAVAIYVSIGIFVGTMAGYFRGWVDMVFSRFIEIVICFPAFFLILAVLAFLQPGILNIMIVIGITGWTTEARLVRGEFLRLADQEFVLAAKGLGVSNWRIIFRHILPNGLAPVLVAASFGVASAILIESSLSFLGFGISIPVPSWGGILNEARENFRYWWITIFPGLAIFSTVTAYNLVGEGVRDAIDPRLKL